MQRVLLVVAAVALSIVTRAATTDDPEDPIVDYGPPSLWTDLDYEPELDPSEYEVVDDEADLYPDDVLDDDQWEEDVDEEGPALRDADAEALNEFHPMSQIDAIIDN